MRAPLHRNESGATAAEFALLLPLFLLFLLGLIDVGRYAWSVNRAQKAVQIGARWAVATDVVPQGLYDYSFAISGGIPQGTVVPRSAFGGITCQSAGGAVTCTCDDTAACDASWEVVDQKGSDAFARLVARMHRIHPSLGPANVVIDYKYSGLGFSGDPGGADVSPLVTVRLRNLSFPLMFMLGRRVPLPNLSYAQTLEDGEGTVSNSAGHSNQAVLMGNYETPLLQQGAKMFTLPGGLFIVANALAIDRLRTSPSVAGFDAAAFVALPANAELPAEVALKARVLVLEVDPSCSESLRRIAKLRAEREDLPIIAALAQADVSLVRTLIRQGIADVAELPFVPEELASQILDATTRLAEQNLPGLGAPLTTIARSTGGCGATTVVTHLAAVLARSDATGKGVCVIDLDLQGGDVASYIGHEPSVTLSALLDAGDRLDGEMLRNAAAMTRYGFSLVAAPEAITPLDTVDDELLLRLLSLAGRQFGHVLIDLPPDWTNWALSAVSASSRVLVVTDVSVSCLRQAKRRIDLLRSIGVPSEQISVIANRIEHRLFKTIGTGEVGDALDCRVAASLTDEGSAMRSAQDQGLLITDIAARSRFAREVQALAETIAATGS